MALFEKLGYNSHFAATMVVWHE